MEKTDLRIVKTLHQIDRALLDGLKTCLFQKITVEMLCKNAMINRSTFYKYYLDKYDLLDKYLSRILDEFQENMNAAFINADPSHIHDLYYIKNFEAALKYIAKYRETYQILWNASIDRKIYNEMTQIVHDNILSAFERQPQPSSQKKKYADLYAFLFASNMMSLIQWWFEYYDTVTMKEVREIMTDNMHHGLFKTFKTLMEKNQPDC